MNIRTALSQWADKTFGTLHPPEDKAVIYEDLAWMKNKDWLQTITLEIKKAEGFQKSWADKEVNEAWKKEIQAIIGDYLKLVINASLGKENSQVSGYLIDEDGTKKEVNEDGMIFRYQFKIEIKRIIKKDRGQS